MTIVRKTLPLWRRLFFGGKSPSDRLGSNMHSYTYVINASFELQRRGRAGTAPSEKSRGGCRGLVQNLRDLEREL